MTDRHRGSVPIESWPAQIGPLCVCSARCELDCGMKASVLKRIGASLRRLPTMCRSSYRHLGYPSDWLLEEFLDPVRGWVYVVEVSAEVFRRLGVDSDPGASRSGENVEP